MAIAQAKTSRSKRDMRRSHHHLTAATLTECSNCREKALAHTICPHCGFYKGKLVIQPRKD